MNDEETDLYRVVGEIGDGTRSISGVCCDVIVPKLKCGSIQVRCWPDQQQWEQLRSVWEVSFKANLYLSGGEKRGEISMLNGRITGRQSYQRSNAGYEHVVRISPKDLTITEYVRSKPSDSVASGGNFWITPSYLLAPGYITDLSPEEGFRIDSVDEPPFRLENDVQLSFANSHVFIQHEDHSTTVQLELVARFSTTGEVVDTSKMLPLVEELLLVASLAERAPISCAGWSCWDRYSVQQYYRRDHFRR